MSYFWGRTVLGCDWFKLVHASVETYNNKLIFERREISLKQDTINFIKNEINTSTCLAVEVDEFEEELLNSYTNKPLSHQHNPLLTVIENKQLESLLEINKDCFALDLLDLKPPIGIDKHRINTITNVPIKLFAYRKS
jgi:hypothetical protein